MTDEEWLRRELRGLRIAHDRYGVTEEMYPWVGAALIDTLREALGAEFTPDVEGSWREAYARLSEVMLSNPG